MSIKFSSGRRRVKIVCVAAVAGILAPVALTSCAPAASPDDNTITIFASQYGQMDLNTNSFTKELEQKFGVDLVFQTTTADGASASQALNVSLAGGQLPDAYMLIPWVAQLTPSQVQKYGDQGLFIPLNDLITQYAPNVNKFLTTIPDFKAMTTTPTGKIYGLPQWNDCFHCSYPAKYWINTTWLEKLNLQVPKTVDEFYSAMVAFKDKDPNGNGKKDEIPMSGSALELIIPFFMNAFIYNGWYESTATGPVSLGLSSAGKVQLQPAQDGWREGLKYLNKLWAAGLVDQGTFSQTPETLQKTANSASGVLIGGSSAMHPSLFVTIPSGDGREWQYNALAPLTGPSGQQFATYQTPIMPGATFAITNKASAAKQKVLMEIVDYLFTTEGAIRGQFGVEGIGWRKPEAGDVALDSNLTPLYYVFPTDDKNPEYYNGLWGAVAQYGSTREFRDSQVQPMDTNSVEGYERRLFDATKLYEGKEDQSSLFKWWTVWPAESDSAELSTTQTNVETYIRTSAAEFITGTRDPNSDADWQAYLSGLNGMGADRYIEIWQKAMDSAPK